MTVGIVWLVIGCDSWWCGLSQDNVTVVIVWLGIDVSVGIVWQCTAWENKAQYRVACYSVT